MRAKGHEKEAFLAEHARELRQGLGGADIKRAQYFYEIGVQIRVIEDEKDVTVYGEGAVERLAEALNQDSAALRRFAAVTRRWPEETFAALSRRPNAHGMPLTWDHWVALAPLRGWESWLERTLTGSWSVEDLTKELERMM